MLRKVMRVHEVDPLTIILTWILTLSSQFVVLTNQGVVPTIESTFMAHGQFQRADTKVEQA